MTTKSEYLEFCPFPKHRGTPWAVVLDEDRRYVEWLVSGDGPPLDPDLEEHLIEGLDGEWGDGP